MYINKNNGGHTVLSSLMQQNSAQHVQAQKQNAEKIVSATDVKGMDVASAEVVSPETYMTLAQHNVDVGDIVSAEGSAATMTVKHVVEADGSTPWAEGNEGWLVNYGDILTSGYPEIADAFENPQQLKQDSLSDYQDFIEQAKDVVSEVEQLDRYGVIDVSYYASGRMVAKIDADKVNELQIPGGEAGKQVLDNIDADLAKMKSWISERQSDIKEMAEKAEPYAIASSIIAYEESTGISPESIKYHNEGKEYLLRIQAYAHSAFGVNAESYASVDSQRGAYVPGQISYVDGTGLDGKKVQAHLPDMS